MAGARPELIFVHGPQEGERAVLMTNAILIGRSSSADVQVRESTASREHLRFELRPEGWVMENLSGHGTRVNGKRYKKKKLLLETGDVVGIGTETEMLYVSPGDDPEEALRGYREAQPKPKEIPAEAETAQAEPVRKQPRPSESAAPPAAEEAAAKPAPKRKEAAGGEEGEVAEDKEGKAGRLKVVLFSVVLVGMVFFGVALIVKSLREEDNTGSQEAGPPRLAPYQIREALEADLERPPSPVKAAAALDEAVRAHANRVTWEPGDLYRCVRSFKLHLAYKDNRTFRRMEDELNFKKVRDDLVALVGERYDTAWKFEKARSFRNAKAAFDEMLLILPVAELDRNAPVYQVIVVNVIDHIKYVKKKLGKFRD
jgi:hypothetical protein